ncbi:MAG: hypothetical protein ACI9JN_001140 [Bacteroidia bacterium]|jgi:hypothetical protein
MKKLINSLLALLVVMMANAQQNIPNGNFEDWGVHKTEVLDNWEVSGNVTSSTDAYSGSKSLRLENIASNKTRGFVSTGPFIGRKLFGVPYDEQPLSVRFRAKFNLALGDKAQIACIFTLKGNTIAFAGLDIEGSSNDTFAYFSIPITWSLSSNPDSVAIAVSSLNLETQEFNGDGYFIIDDLHFASISTRNKALSNGDFENWSIKTRDNLVSWYTTDDYFIEISGQEFLTPLVAKSNKGRSGTMGVELTSQSLNGDLVPAMIIVGDKFADIEQPTFPMNKRWKYFEGYYQYKPVNGDSAFFTAFLFKSGVPVGGVQFSVDKAASSYTYFSKEITYFSRADPDSAIVFIMASNPDETRGDGTWLLLDDIKFSDNNSSVFDLRLNKLTVYPNPFKTEINLAGIDQMIGADYTIVDVLGKPISHGLLTRNITIDLSDQLPGVYVLHISGKHVKTTKILIKE